MNGLHTLLKKNEITPLPLQISQILRDRILGGAYATNNRLESVRSIAADFKVSPVTVIKALDFLEDEHLIHRIPMKGIFVSESQQSEKKQLNACFAFPEKAISQDILSRETWGLNSELYRGLLAGAQEYGVNLQFSYFAEHPTPDQLSRQKAVVHQFDFMIFAGPQLPELRNAASLHCPVFCKTIQGQNLPARETAVDYDREDAMEQLTGYLKESRAETAAVITSSDFSRTRTDLFISRAREAGIQITEDDIWTLNPSKGLFPAELNKRLSSTKARFIFCDTPEYMESLYILCNQLGLRIGEDILFTAVCSGATFTGLLPKSVYFRIPNFEIGIQIMKSAADSIREDKNIRALPRLKVEKIFKPL